MVDYYGGGCGVSVEGVVGTEIGAWAEVEVDIGVGVEIVVQNHPGQPSTCIAGEKRASAS